MPTGRREITPAEHAALFAVINQSRLVNGWTSRSAQELDPTIRVWFKVFAHYRIPAKYADALYLRALDLRQTFLQNGKEPPLLTAELLAACWTGANGLENELRQQEIARGRTLTANAATKCRHCFGTGHRYKFDEDGKPLGIAGKCDHND